MFYPSSLGAAASLYVGWSGQVKPWSCAVEDLDFDVRERLDRIEELLMHLNRLHLVGRANADVQRLGQVGGGLVRRGRLVVDEE